MTSQTEPPVGMFCLPDIWQAVAGLHKPYWTTSNNPVAPMPPSQSISITLVSTFLTHVSCSQQSLWWNQFSDLWAAQTYPTRLIMLCL